LGNVTVTPGTPQCIDVTRIHCVRGVQPLGEFCIRYFPERFGKTYGGAMTEWRTGIQWFHTLNMSHVRPSVDDAVTASVVITLQQGRVQVVCVIIMARVESH
jgi:hypothetical protein